MTSGSGNGWPDVIKVPAQKADHDPLCPLHRGHLARCECDLIAKVRADEVERRFGWVSQEDARAWFLADLRAKVEALPSERVNGRDCYWADDMFDLIDGGMP